MVGYGALRNLQKASGAKGQTNSAAQVMQYARELVAPTCNPISV